MNFELFDPQNPCNPILPYNKDAHKYTFYKISVFEKTLDTFSYIKNLPDGKIPAKGNYNPLTTLRLGIPLTDLFPQVNPYLKTALLESDVNQPIRFGLDDVYLPSKRKEQYDAKIKEVLVPGDELIDGKEVEVDGVKVKLNEGMIRDLKAKKFFLYKHDAKVIRLKTDPKKPMGAAPLAFSYAPNLDPKTMDDDLYFEFLGALLFDPRSGQTSAGAESSNIHPAALSNDVYYVVLNLFIKDPRYSKFFDKKKGSGGVVLHKAVLPAYEIALFSSFEQSWELEGYSRGSLINSITLIPKEEATIEVFSWDKHKVEEEREKSTEFEKNIETSSLARVSTSVAADLNESTDTGGDIGLGIPLPIEGVPVKVDANATVAHSIKEGLQSTVDTINESTQRVVEKFKSTVKVKVVQTHEFGTEKRTIRKIFNPNAGRTLTFNYFEILETHKVTTKLKDTKKFCLLVENPDLGPIDHNFVLAYQDKIEKALLSNTYKDGFEAAKKLVAQYWFDKESEVKKEIENANKVNSLQDPSTPSAPQKPIVKTALNLKKILNKFINVDLLKAAEVLANYYNPWDGVDVTSRQKADAEDALGLFNFWFKFKMLYPGFEGKAMDYCSNISETTPEAKIVEELELLLVGMDDDWVTGLKMLAVNLVAINLSTMVAIPFPILVPILLELAIIENNGGLPPLITKAKEILKTYELATSAQTLANTTTAETKIPKQDPPPALFPLEDLALAAAEFEKLRLHIEANKIYYLNQIFKYEDANSRYERLKLKGLHNYVENRLIGFIGNKSVFPLRMASLEPFTQEELKKQILNFDKDSVDTVNGVDYGPIQSTTTTATLPTEGVYVESMIGRCEALEDYLIERRKLDIEARKIALKAKELENERLALRLNQNPPVLDFPFFTSYTDSGNNFLTENEL